MANPRGFDARDPHRASEGPDDAKAIALVPDDPNKLHWGRGVNTAVWSVLILLALAACAVWVLSSTDWGRERVRRVAQDFVNSQVHGRATIGRLSGNLLTGVVVHDFTLTDSAGQPFISVESIRGRYSIIGLFRKRLWFRDVVAIRPMIVLDRPPNGKWNWQNIFPRDTTPRPPSAQTKWGDYLRFTQSQVIEGQLIVRSPWKPSAHLAPAARDSAIREAMSGRGRLMIKRVPGGFQKIVQLDTVTAAIPLLRLSEPGFEDRLLELSALRMTAYPFRPPAAKVRDLKGAFPFNNDSIWWRGVYAALPASKATGDGKYIFDTGDLTMKLHAGPASFADMRWIYPNLPPGGRGKFDLTMTWLGAVQDYLITDADVTLNAAHLTGDIGVTFADTLTIHNTNVRFSAIDTRTIEQLVPGTRFPRRGTFSGRARVNGGRHALSLNTDLTFNDQRAGVSRVIAVGDVGFPGRGVRATNLRLQMLPVQVDMARTWFPSLPIRGTVTGSLTVNGNTASQLRLAGNLDHRDRGARSVIDGGATVRLASSGKVRWFDVDVVTRPVSLVTVGRFLPAAGLHGSATGPVRLTGTLADVRVDASLRLPDGGHFTTRGTLDLTSRELGYDLTAQLYALNLRAITTKAPETSLTAFAVGRGRGFKPETMRATLAADLSTSRWDTVAVDTASIRVNIADGLADVDRLYAAGYHAVASAHGSFGLSRTRNGTLTYRVAIDSLGALNRWLPRSAATGTSVAPRPGPVTRAYRRARADSAREFRRTEIERMISGRPGPRLNVRVPRTVPVDTLSGTLYAAGVLSGNIYNFDLRGRAGGENIVARGNLVRRFQSEYAWNEARTPQSKLVVALDADSVSAMGFQFDTVMARLTYTAPTGSVQVAVIQDQHRHYRAEGDFALAPERKEVRLTDVTLLFDTTTWSMPRPSLVQWGGPGLRISDFELRNRGNGRVYANGLLPTEGVADFRLDIDEFPVSNIVDITQTDIDASGLLMLHGTMAGTLRSPAFRGAFGLVNGVYNGTPVPDLRGRFGYADRELVAHIDALRATGESITKIDGRLPIDLALTGVTGDRVLPGPVAIDLVADSLPLELIPHFTDLVSTVHGRAAGKVAVRGTVRQPILVGGFELDRGVVTLTSTGATIEDIGATLRMAHDTVYIDSMAGSAKGPVRLRGTIAVREWRDPSFNLYLVSEGAELLNNKYGKVRVDAGLAMTGPLTQAYVSGAITVTQGVFNAPEAEGRHVISAGDPQIFNVIDTAIVSDRELLPAPSPLLTNLRAELMINVHHNTWVRNREANVEIYTEDPVYVRLEQEAFSLTGVVTTDRGEYSFLSRRFQIKRGSAIFIGTSELNPTLQITGEFQVQAPSRSAINIRVLIGGTLRNPRLSLESDAQPPRTQSELLTLLAFGQSTTNLLASGASSIVGSAAASDLFGVGAQVAVKRLAGVALGVAVQQVEAQAGRALGVDMFNITPADIPSGNVVGTFFTQTKIEAGKYINPRTFVSGQFQANRPGFSIDHKTADGWHFNAAFEPRILLLEPTLNNQPFRTLRSFGGFIAREWRF